MLFRLIALLSMAIAVAACDSGSNGSSSPDPQTPGPIINLDDTNPVTSLTENRSHELAPPPLDLRDGSSVTSWIWSDPPIREGALLACEGIEGFDSSLAASRLDVACVSPSRCIVAFDQVASLDTEGGGQTRFEVNIPALRAPIGLTYLLNATSDIGEAAARSYTFCLIPENEPPIAMDDVFTVVEGVPLVITSESASHLLSNDQDDEDFSNDPLGVLSDPVRAPEFGSQFTLQSDGGFTYFYAGDSSVAGGVQVEDSFEYNITDGTSVTSALVTLKIVTTDDPPVFTQNPTPVTTVAGVFTDIDLSGYFTDPEGSELSFTANPSSLPLSLEVSPLGVLTGTPSADDITTYVVEITSSDQASQVQGQIELIITVNQTPTITEIPDQQFEYGELVTIEASDYFNDPEDVPLSFSLASTPESGLQINQATGRISGLITASGDYTLTVTAADGVSEPVSDSFSITQQAIPNRPPVFTGTVSPQTVTIGQAIPAITVSFDDPDGDDLSYTVNVLPAGVTFNVASETLSGNPSTLGVTNVIVTATDPAGLSTSSDPISITVTALPNQPPEFTGRIADASGTVGTLIGQISGNFRDPEGEALIYTSGTLPAGLSLDPDTGIISGTPTAEAAVTVIITATDPDDEAVTSNGFTITIDPQPNNPPTISGIIGGQEVTVGSPISPVTGNFEDPDSDRGDSLRYTLTTPDVLPDGYQFNPTTGRLSGSPAVEGDTTFTITATDQSDESVSSNPFVISVNPVPNNPPVFRGPIPPQSGTVGTVLPVVSVAGFFSDLDGDPRTYSLAAGSSLPVGLVLSDTGVISGTPTSPGSVNVSIVATDTVGGGTATSTPPFVFSIARDNQAPVLNGAIPAQTGTVGTTIGNVSVTTFFQDADGDVMEFTVAPGSQLPVGLVLSTAGVISGTPTVPGAVGVRIVATDTVGGGSVTSEEFSFTIVQPNRQPTFSGTIEPSAGIVGTQFSAFSVASFFTDPDGDPLTYTLAIGSVLPSGLTLSTAGVVRGIPTAEITVDVEVVATDSVGGGSATSTPFRISIAAANAAPELVGAIPAQSGTVLTEINPFPVTSFFRDPDDDSLTYALLPTTSLPVGLTLSSAGIITGTPTVADVVSVTIVATDTVGGESVTASSFLFTIAAGNQDPTFTGMIDDQLVTVDIAITPFSIAGLFNDPDDALTFTLGAGTALPIGLELLPNGTIQGTPTLVQTVNPMVVATETGGDGTVSSNAFVFEVAAGNQDPTFTGIIDDQLATVDIAIIPFSVAGLFNDPDDALTFTLGAGTALPTGLELLPNGTIQGTPTLVQTVNPVVVATETGGDGTVSSNAFVFEIAAGNQDPIFTGMIDDQLVTVDIAITPFSVAGLFNDPDDALTFTLGAGTALPTGLELLPNGTIQGTPTLVQTVNPMVVATETGGDGTVSSNAFVFEVAAGNQDPTFTGMIDDQLVTVDIAITPFSVAGLFNDPDDALTFTLGAGTALPTGLELLPNGTIQGTPTLVQTVNPMVVATETGGDGTVSSNAFVFEIAAGNQDPTFTGMIDDQLATVDITITPFSVAGLFNDPDDALTFTLDPDTALPTGLELLPDGTIQGTPTLVQTVNPVVVATETGGDGTVSSNAFVFEIAAGNQDPTFTGMIDDQLATVDITITPFSVAGLFNDPDDALTFTLDPDTALPTGLELLPDGTIQGTPTLVQTVNPVVVATETGGDGTVSSNAFVFEIAAGNQDPTFAGNILEQTAIIGTPIATFSIANFFEDLDADPLMFDLATGSSLPDGLTLSSAGEISGTPSPASVSQSGLVIEASDGNGGTAVSNPFDFIINTSA